MNITRDITKTGFVRLVEGSEHGYRHAIFVSELPERAEGGYPDSHVLVTIMAPVRSAHVFAREGTLSVTYVHEKLFSSSGRWDPDSWTGQVAERLTRLIAFALERTAHIPGEEQDDEREGEAQ